MGRYVLQSSIYLSTTGHVDDVNDQYIGRNGASFNNTALLGKCVEFGRDSDALFYNSAPAAAQPAGVASTKNLYAGAYMLVQKTTSITVAYGQIAYWLDKANFIVTNAASGLEVAGIFLNAITDSYYGYIKLAIPGDEADVLIVDSPTKGSVAATNLVMTSGTAGKGDVLADATALTGTNFLPFARAESTQNSTTKLIKAQFGVSV